MSKGSYAVVPLETPKGSIADPVVITVKSGNVATACKGILQITRSSVPREAPRELTEEEKTRDSFQFLRKSLRDTKLVGRRATRSKRKAEKDVE